MAPDSDLFPDEPQAPTAGTAQSSPQMRGAKVELDIDDAPFLGEKEEAKPVAAPQNEAPPAPKAQPVEPKTLKSVFLSKLLADKKKLAAVIGACVVLFVILPVSIMLLMGGEKAPPAPPVERVVVSGEPQRDDAPAGPSFLFRLGSFFIERQGSEGELRFLRASFAVPTENPGLFIELGVKELAVRDAIYYYLRNKPLTFLVDKDSKEDLKQDLLSVINEQVSAEQVTEIFVEEYLVTGS